MSESRPVPLIGRIAVQMRLITAAQLEELTRAQAQTGDTKGLGDLMVERGWIDREKLVRVLGAEEQGGGKGRGRQAVEQGDAEPEMAPSPAAKPSAGAAAAAAPPAKPAAKPT